VNDVTPVPPDNTVPPVAAAYQSTVTPPLTAAEIFTAPDPQTDPFVPVGAVGKALIVAAIVVLEDTQPVVVFLASA